jgi:hypothetical protein
LQGETLANIRREYSLSENAILAFLADAVDQVSTNR